MTPREAARASVEMTVEANVDARLQGLLAAYRSALDAWLELADGLDDADWPRPTGCPGWDVHDQLAHVVALERVLLGDPPDRVELPEGLAHVRGEVGRRTEVGVQARRHLAPGALVAEARETFDRRLAQLAATDPAELDRMVDSPVGMRLRGAALLRTRIYDIVTHEHDVRRATGRRAAGGGGHVPIAVEQVVRGWARLLPVALGETVGSSAVLGVEVDGVEVARIGLGDGTLHRGGEGPPADAVLEVEVGELLAIGGGRSDAPTVDEVRARGDRAVVGAVLAVATITP